MTVDQPGGDEKIAINPNAPPIVAACAAASSAGGPKGRANGNYRDGTFTAEAIQERKWLRSVVRTYGKLGQP